MSGLSITEYFPFMRVKITEQSVHHEDACSALIKMVPDKRYRPLCHQCGQKAGTVHSNGHIRMIRDLNIADRQKQGIEAVAIDMWEPYINRINHHCPDAHIVFDFFHVVQAFGKVIDKVRRDEYP